MYQSIEALSTMCYNFNCCTVYVEVILLMARKNINTTLDEDLYTELKILAIKLKTNANDLIEEGMKYVIEKYKQQKK